MNGSFDNTVRLWDVATGALKSELIAGISSSINSVSFSPDGATLASASAGWGGTVRLWDVATGTVKSELTDGVIDEFKFVV